MAIINITNESPGVYTRLQDQSQFSPQVSETKGGIVGVANKGPIGIPTLLTGQNEFDDIFGTPSLNGYGGLAARNLLGQINQVYFTRIATAAARSSSGTITAPATSAETTGSNFANYSFGFNQDNNQLLIAVNGSSVQGIEFEEGTYETDEIVDTLAAVFVGEASVTNVSGNIKIRSLVSGAGSSVDIKSESSALTTLGFDAGEVVGEAATSAFITSTNSNGTFSATPFSSVSSLDVKFNNDIDLVVKLTGSFIDGIDNVVDLVTEFNNFAGNNVSTSLANSATVDQEKIRFTSPTTGTTSVVEILSSSTSDVLSVLGLTAASPVSGDAATFAEVTNDEKHGYDLSSATTLKFQVDLLPEKTITFNTSGNVAFSELSYTSGAAIATGNDILVGEWTFHMETTSGNLNSSTKEFDVAVGSSSIDSWAHLDAAINTYVDDVSSTMSYNSGTLSGLLTVSAVEPGRTGNNIVFNTTEVTSYFDTKNPSDQTLGYGNGSVLSDLTQAKIQDVVTEINRQAGSIYAYQDDGKIRLSSETTGASSRIEITGSNTALGFVSGDIKTGDNRSDIIIVTAATTGTWADGVVVTTFTPTGTNDVGINVFENGVLVEQFGGTTINALDDFIEKVVNGNSDYIRVDYIGDLGDEVPASLTTTLQDGDSGSFVTDQEVVNAIKLYDNSELINISLFAAPGYSSTQVLQEFNRVANSREDVFVIVDPPVGYNAQQVINWHNGEPGSGNSFKLDNKYMGLYWPWVRINDAQNGQIRLVPPSVVLLELIARNDNEQFPFTAPAGTSAGLIRRAIDIEVSANQTDRDALYSDRDANNVNPIINLLGRGTVVWGQKTLQREFTALNRINVSRLIIYVRRNIRDIALDLVFQPNDSTTWDIFVDEASKFLQTVVSNRGIVEFNVVMDSTTNTPQTIAENKLFGYVTIKPRLVAEQIVLTFQVVGQDFEFTN